MKILDVCEFYAPQGGGVKTYITNKLRLAAAFGHQCVIIAPGPESRDDIVPGGKIVWVKAPKLVVDPRYHIFWDAEPVLSVIAREMPDVIEASSPWRGAWIAAQGKARAHVLFVHSDPVASYVHTGFDRWARRDTLDRSVFWFWSYLKRLSQPFDAVVMSGEWLTARFKKWGNIDATAISFGFDSDAFSPELRNESVRVEWLKRCGLGPEASLLIAVGRHHPEKRLKTLIRAVTSANATRPIGLAIIGDGLSRKATERAVERLEHICVADPIWDRTELATVIASADALIHGCSSETFGLVIAEALASGVPVVVPDVGGAADLAKPDFSETYAPGDAAGASQALLRLLARPRGQMSEAAHTAALAIGSIDDHFLKLFSYYEQLIAEKG